MMPKREKPAARAAEVPKATIPQMLEQAGTVLDSAKTKRTRRRKPN